MVSKFDIIFAIFMFLFGCAVGACFAFYFHIKEHKNDVERIVVSDTTYNKIVLDSIEYNIVKKDSIVYNLKKEMKDEISKSLSINDSDAINLFKELCTAN